MKATNPDSYCGGKDLEGEREVWISPQPFLLSGADILPKAGCHVGPGSRSSNFLPVPLHPRKGVWASRVDQVWESDKEMFKEINGS